MTPVSSKHWGRMIFFGLALLLTGCQTTSSLQPGHALREGFTCCNLHYEDDWINDGNYAELPMIPVGTPIKVLSYGSNKAKVQIEGKPFRLGHDYGRDQESLQQWVAKIVVPADPKLTIANYPANVKESIRRGMVMPGMNKEQVIMSLGYPLTSETPSLDARIWRYWISSFDEYQILWDKQGLVEDIVAAPTAKTRVIYHPSKNAKNP